MCYAIVANAHTLLDIESAIWQLSAWNIESRLITPEDRHLAGYHCDASGLRISTVLEEPGVRHPRSEVSGVHLVPRRCSDLSSFLNITIRGSSKSFCTSHSPFQHYALHFRRAQPGLCFRGHCLSSRCANFSLPFFDGSGPELLILPSSQLGRLETQRL